MKHISERLLKCSCTLYHAEGKDKDRNTTWGTAIDLSKVWLTSTRSQTTGTNGKEPSDVMELTYDVYNSRPLNVTFAKGDKVVFNGYEYYINSINPVYTDGLSHYVIGLK